MVWHERLGQVQFSKWRTKHATGASRAVYLNCELIFPEKLLINFGVIWNIMSRPTF